MNTPKTLAKYLGNYAEPEINKLSKFSQLPEKEYVIVIPVYREQPNFLERLQSHPDAHRLLLILVVNEPQSQTSKASNTALLEHINTVFKLVETHDNISLRQSQALAILCVNKTGKHAIGDKHGVGLARKIGSDMACWLNDMGRIKTPIIFCSDADTYLPYNYFFSNSDPSIGAWVYNFSHISSDHTLLAATRIYENCIHYYRDQLEQAGSPYAYHSLGSCIAINIHNYAQVRGFPKRAAGEDFYLLNKVVKTGKIEKRNQSCVQIDARLSDRVPFGTGPGVTKIMNTLGNQETPRYYNRQIFVALASVLNNAEAYFTETEQLSKESHEALAEAGFEHFRKSRKKQDKDVHQFTKQFHHWFDAFQTLKFVRRLRTHFPDENIDLLF